MLAAAHGLPHPWCDPVVEWTAGPSRMIGRKSENAVFATALRAAARPGAHVLLVTGPRGCGRSRLLDAWAERAGRSGAVVLRPAGATTQDPAEAVVRRWRARLDALPAEQTAVLLVDDLHRAGQGVRAAVPFIARHAGRQRLLVVVSHPADVGELPELAHLGPDELTRLWPAPLPAEQLRRVLDGATDDGECLSENEFQAVLDGAGALRGCPGVALDLQAGWRASGTAGPGPALPESHPLVVALLRPGPVGRLLRDVAVADLLRWDDLAVLAALVPTAVGTLAVRTDRLRALGVLVGCGDGVRLALPAAAPALRAADPRTATQVAQALGRAPVGADGDHLARRAAGVLRTFDAGWPASRRAAALSTVVAGAHRTLARAAPGAATAEAREWGWLAWREIAGLDAGDVPPDDLDGACRVLLEVDQASAAGELVAGHHVSWNLQVEVAEALGQRGRPVPDQAGPDPDPESDLATERRADGAPGPEGTGGAAGRRLHRLLDAYRTGEWDVVLRLARDASRGLGRTDVVGGPAVARAVASTVESLRARPTHAAGWLGGVAAVSPGDWAGCHLVAVARLLLAQGTDHDAWLRVAAQWASAGRPGSEVVLAAVARTVVEGAHAGELAAHAADRLTELAAVAGGSRLLTLDALVRSGRGEGPAAVAAARQAVDLAAVRADALLLARARLLLGRLGEDPPLHLRAAHESLRELGCAEIAAVQDVLRAASLPLPRARRAGGSRRDATVLRELSRGASNRQLASRLGVSEKTVEGWISRLLERYGVRNRVELAEAWAAGRRVMGPTTG